MNKRIKKKQLAMTYRRFDKCVNGIVRIKPKSFAFCGNGLVVINKRFVTESFFRTFRVLFLNTHYGSSSEIDLKKHCIINPIRILSKYISKFPKWSLVMFTPSPVHKEKSNQDITFTTENIDNFIPGGIINE